jgi:hypothetical protein
VTAELQTVLKRIDARSKVTGRVVPPQVTIDSMRTIPESLSVLEPRTNFMATFSNEDGQPEPRIESCSMKNMKHFSPTAALHTDWSLRYKSDNEYVYDDHNLRNCTLLNTWKDLFKDVWVMNCALPSPSNKTKINPNSKSFLLLSTLADDSQKGFSVDTTEYSDETKTLKLAVS